MDIVRHQRHFLDDFLLEVKPAEGALEFVVELLEFPGQSFGRGRFVREGRLPGGVLVVHFLVQGADLLEQLAQVLADASPAPRPSCQQ